MSTFSAIDLGRLPQPVIIEQPTFETIFSARKARLIELAPDLAPVLELESEPLVQLLQEDSYRELLLRAAVQDAGKGNMLAFAQGAELDHIAAFYGVARQVVIAADANAIPPVEQVMEDDARLRERVQLAPESFTTAGSIGSYTFWALAASPLVKDVDVSSPVPGEVEITILSTEANGVAGSILLDVVAAEVDPRRPLCDLVTTKTAVVVGYEVHATLTLYDGFDSEVVRAASEQSLIDHIAARHSLGHDITISGLHAALHREGVQNVDLGAFSADLIIASDQAAFCTAQTVNVGGIDV